MIRYLLVLVTSYLYMMLNNLINELSILYPVFLKRAAKIRTFFNLPKLFKVFLQSNIKNRLLLLNKKGFYREKVLCRHESRLLNLHGALANRGFCIFSHDKLITSFFRGPTIAGRIIRSQIRHRYDQLDLLTLTRLQTSCLGKRFKGLGQGSRASWRVRDFGRRRARCIARRALGTRSSVGIGYRQRASDK